MRVQDGTPPHWRFVVHPTRSHYLDFHQHRCHFIEISVRLDLYGRSLAATILTITISGRQHSKFCRRNRLALCEIKTILCSLAYPSCGGSLIFASYADICCLVWNHNLSNLCFSFGKGPEDAIDAPGTVRRLFELSGALACAITPYRLLPSLP